MGFHSIARATCTYCRPHPHFVASSWNLGVVHGRNAYSTGIGIMLQMNAFQGSFSTFRSLPLAQQAEAVEDGDSKRSLQSEFWSEPCPPGSHQCLQTVSSKLKAFAFFFFIASHCSSHLGTAQVLFNREASSVRLSFPKPPCLNSLLPPPVLVTLEKNSVSP